MTRKLPSLYALAMIAVLSFSSAEASAAGLSIQVIFSVLPSEKFLVDVRSGCDNATTELREAASCRQLVRAADVAKQVDAIDAAIADHAAIAIDPIPAPEVIAALGRAVTADLPIVTFLNDLPQPDQHLRGAFLTNPSESLGPLLATLTRQFSSAGGTYCTLYDPADPLQATWHGTLASELRRTNPADPLRSWVEAPGCPMTVDQDPGRAALQVRDALRAMPGAAKLMVVLTEIPQSDVGLYKAAMEEFREEIFDYELAVFAYGDENVQLDLLGDIRVGTSATSTVQIGPRAIRFGYDLVYLMKALSEGETVANPIIHIGYDVCRRDNAAECTGAISLQ